MLAAIRPCVRCRKPFAATRPNRRYCTKQCAEIANLEKTAAHWQARLRAKLDQAGEPSPQWHSHDLTPEQVAEVVRFQKPIEAEVILKASEGTSTGAMLTAFGNIVAALVESQIGREAIAPWHLAQAQLWKEKP